MLGSDQFAFETPNVIDPGDLPPSRPLRSDAVTAETAESSFDNGSGEDHDANHSRSHENDLNRSHTDNDDADADEYDEYNDIHNRRLLNDINDLELSPVKRNSHSIPFRDFKPYSPYEDDPTSNNNNNNNYHSNGFGNDVPHAHSLTSAEEARLHAASLLHANRGFVGQKVPLRAPRIGRLRRGTNANNSLYGDDDRNKHLVRQRIFAVMKQSAVVVFGLAALIGIIVGVASLLNGKGKNHAMHRTDGDNTVHNSVDTILDYSHTDRFDDAVRYLASAGISDEALLRQSGTPQNTALNWMVGVDPLAYAIDTNTNSPDTRFTQRYVLVVFYFATGGGGGNGNDSSTGWDHTVNFLTAEDECAWNALVTIPEYVTPELSVGVACNSGLHVSSLFLPGNGLTGYLPSELRFLPALTLVGLENNALEGPLPNEWRGAWPELLYFNIYFNRLTGTVPEYFGDFGQLEVLGLGQNTLTGSLPASLGTLPRLKTLGLSDNQLTGSLDVCIHLTELKYLYAARNQFAGTVDENFFVYAGRLIELDLSQNQLQGRVPLNILFHEHNLHVIDLAHNQFTGSFPEIVDTNVVLHFLSLRDNQLTGSLPQSIWRLDELRHLDLHNNTMTGTIPNELGAIRQLEYLFLGGGGNRFDATNMPPLSQSYELKELSLSHLNMTGSIPTWFQFLKSLQMLDLSHNALTGTIPETVWNLPTLYILLLHDNAGVTGTLPSRDSGGGGGGGQQLEVLSVHHTAIQDPDMDSILCQTDNHLNVAVVDCGAGCTSECCPECCPPDDMTCATEVTDVYADGLDYAPDPFSFDPDLLDEAGLFGIVDENGNVVPP